MSLADAQAETQAILANLTKGHDALLTEATNKSVKPMNFAWDGDAMSKLKTLSETGAAFPVYNLGDKVEPFKPKSGNNPIGTTHGFESASAWKTEAGANFQPSPSKEDADVVAGFKSFDQVNLPTQFAWNRLTSQKNIDEAADEEKGGGKSWEQTC